MEFTEINGEYEYGAKALVSLDPEEFNPEESIRDLVLDWRGGGDWDEDLKEGFLWNGDGCTAIQLDNWFEVSEKEFKVLKNHIFSVRY